MKIVVLNMYLTDDGGNVKAYTDVLIGNTIRIHGLKLIKVKDDENFFLGMPSRKKTTPDGDVFFDVCEIIDADFKNKATKVILDAFETRKHTTKATAAVLEASGPEAAAYE